MRAALLMAPSKIEIHEIAQPVPAEGEVLIHSIRAGICGTDVSIYHGHRPIATYPFVLGHELVGHVVEVAEGVTKLSVGQRVVVEPNYPCGACAICLSGRGNICPKKQSMGVTVAGCFADYVAAPADFVWALPDSISDLDAATIEPLTVSLHALLQSGAIMGDTVAVLGCGVIGLLLIHTAVRQGIKVLAHDKFEHKLGAATRLGAVVSPANGIKKLWQDEGVSTVFECSGASAAVELSIASAPRGSRIILLGLASSPANFMPFRLVREGIRLEGSLIYDHPSEFARSIALVASGVLHPSCIVSDTFQFSSIADAMELACTGHAGKIHTVID